MEAAVTALGSSWDLLDRDDDGGNIEGLSYWTTILWTEHIWPVNAVPFPAEGDSLVAWLSGALPGSTRNLFMSGSDISYYAAGTVLHDQYLHAQYITDTTFTTTLRPMVAEDAAVLDESFDHGGAPPPGWTIESAGPGLDWGVVKGTRLPVGQRAGVQDERLISPLLIFPRSPAHVFHAYNDYDSSDSAAVEVSVDGGVSFPFTAALFDGADVDRFEALDLTSIAATSQRDGSFPLPWRQWEWWRWTTCAWGGPTRWRSPRTLPRARVFFHGEPPSFLAGRAARVPPRDQQRQKPPAALCGLRSSLQHRVPRGSEWSRLGAAGQRAALLDRF